MARLKFKGVNRELSELGSLMYDLAKKYQEVGPNRAELAPLENEIEGLFEDPPHGQIIKWCYDDTKYEKVIHIVVPDLSNLTATEAVDGSGKDKFANEVLGFVVVFGCGP